MKWNRTEHRTEHIIIYNNYYYCSVMFAIYKNIPQNKIPINQKTIANNKKSI